MTTRQPATHWLFLPLLFGAFWSGSQVLAEPAEPAKPAGPPAEPKGEEAAPVWQWGQAEPSGLVLGAWNDPKGSRTLIGCAIANHGAQPAAFNSYFAGKDEAITVRARVPGEAEWKEVPWRDDALIIYANIGPDAKDVRTLEPGEQFLPHAGFKPLALFSFIIIPSRYKWPQTKGPLEIQIEQRLYSAGPGTPLEARLLSGALSVDAAQLQPRHRR